MVRRLVLATLAAVLATAVLTWPQVLHLGTAAPDHIDTTFNIWRVSWIAHQLPRAPADLFDANIFHPLRRTLALSDPILVPGLLGAPLIWAGVHPLTVTNLLIVGAFVLNAIGAGALAWHLTRSQPAAALAGLVYAFAPFRFDHYMHLELLWACWMPLALVALHQLIASGSVRAGLAFGALIGLQVLSCLYYGIFFATTLGVLVPLLVWRGREAALAPVARGLALGVLVVAVAVAPYVQPLLRNRYLVGERSTERAINYSGRLVGYATATPDNWLYGSTASLARGERRFFPGVVPVVCAVAALAPPLTPVTVAYGAATAFAFDATLGFNGVTYPVLYRLLPPYRGLRVPARFNGIFLLGLSVLSAVGLERLLRRVASQPARRAVAAAIVGLTAIEYAAMPVGLAPLERDPPPSQAWLRTQPRGPVAVVPLPRPGWWPEHDSRYQYWSVFHWQPLLNGYSGFYPRQYRSTLSAAQGFPDAASLDVLRARGVRYVVVHGRYLPPERYAEMVERLAASPDVRLGGVFPDADREARVYELVASTPDTAGR